MSEWMWEVEQGNTRVSECVWGGEGEEERANMSFTLVFNDHEQERMLKQHNVP